MQTVRVWWVNSSLIPSEDMITKVLSNNSTSDGDDDGSDGGGEVCVAESQDAMGESFSYSLLEISSKMKISLQVVMCFNLLRP